MEIAAPLPNSRSLWRKLRTGLAQLSVVAGCIVSASGQSAEEDPLPPLPPVDPNQEQPVDWTAWLSVPKLLGVSEADITSGWSFTGEITRQRQSGHNHATVFMELELPPPEERIPGSTVWWRVVSANAAASISSSYSSYGLGAGQWLGSEGITQGSFTGPLSLRVDPTLSFRLRDGVGQFTTLHEPTVTWNAESSGTVTELNPVGSGVVTREFHDFVAQDPFQSPLEHSPVDFTAPRMAVPFTARFFVEGPSGDGSGRGEGSFQRTANIQFWPDWNDVEVRVEIEDSTNPETAKDQPGTSYANWRPEGNLLAPDQGGPRPLRLKATLRPKAENPTPEQLQALPLVRRFRFELSDTSREPGVCMNWPVPAGTNAPPEDPEYDLRFIATVPQAMELSPKKTKAGVKPLPGEDPTLPSAWVLLECFDFGAHADVQVYADLADGRVIVGYLKVGEDKRYRIPIPDRPPGSLVAKKWRDENKITGADTDDDDNLPEGDGQKGDGFSVYEEYRGFRVDGKHVSPDPWVKNLFVYNLNVGPASAGCRALEKFTRDGDKSGLIIYDELLDEELHSSRIMNLNRTRKSPRSSEEPQHGILVEINPNADTNVIYSYANPIQRGGPRRPKNYSSLLVHPADLNAMTVAHELSHAIGVRHHGDLDYEAEWIVKELPGPNKTTVRRFFEQVYSVDVTTGALSPVGNPFPITVFNEGSSTQKIPDQSTNTPVPSPTSEYIARNGGQHSGDVACNTLYDSLTAYMPPNSFTVRIIPNATNDVPEVPRHSSLCRSCTGTGPNPKRHGHATVGNCLAQVCVRDSAPERAPAINQCTTSSPSPSRQATEPRRPLLAAVPPRASLQAVTQLPASQGILVFQSSGQGTPLEVVRGWPWHFVWQVLEPGTIEPTLSIAAAGGVALTVNASESGQWWISPEQSQNLPLGLATVRVGAQSLAVRLVDPPVEPPALQQDRERRLAFISYYLASGQPAPARAMAEEWIAANPQAPLPRALLGDALALQGLFSEAMAAYHACLARMQRSDRPPESVLQRFRQVQRAWFAQLPDAPADYFDATPEPVTLEDQDRVFGQDTNGQWAATALASSEYRTSGDYSASRATGAPDVTRYGDSLKAWASRLADAGPEWLELTFSNAVVATAVRVRQVFNPGAIQRVELLDAAGTSSTVFSGVDTNQYPSGQIAWFVIRFAPTAQPVQRVRLSLDSARVKGWNEIDAVQLVAAPVSPPPAPQLAFTYQAATGTLEIPTWPAGFILQRATRITSADWQNYATQPPVSVPVRGSPAFFRLVQAP